MITASQALNFFPSSKSSLSPLSITHRHDPWIYMWSDVCHALCPVSFLPCSTPLLPIIAMVLLLQDTKLSNILSIISSPVLLILFCDYISSYACLSDILIFGYIYPSEYAINIFACLYLCGCFGIYLCTTKRTSWTAEFNNFSSLTV